MCNLRGATILAILLISTASCDQPAGLGTPCQIASGAGTSAFDVEEPNIACASRICLRAQGAQGAQGTPADRLEADVRPTADGICTQGCTTDDDCAAEPGGPCASGFACAVPMTEGAWCCTRLCVCRDDLDRLPGPLPIPAACEVADQENRCANLPGR